MRYLPALLIAALPVAGCQEKQPMTVSDFMNNEAALYGTLVRCEGNPSAGTDLECSNARQAAERISVIEERALRKAREEAFASAREEYRARLDRERELRLKAEAEAEEARLQALLNRQQDEEGEAEETDAPGEVEAVGETAASEVEPPPGD
jgi:hypothetical protein